MPYTLTSLDPSRTALLVVDMQNDFVAEGAPMHAPAGTAMIPTLQKVIGECRQAGMTIVFTAHSHRPDGSDMGRFGDLYSAIAERRGLVAGESGAEIHPEVAPVAGDIVVSKHRYSAFFATDLDMILRERSIENVIVTGVTSENCCHATARDAVFHGYRAIFLSDANATHDYPDLGWGGMSAEEVHRSVLIVLAFSTAHVMDSQELFALMGTARS
jgi:nicotinamidase-related amidase